MPITYEEVKKIIEQVPPAERNMPALVVDDKVYTWKEILAEMEKKSPLANKMLIRIEEERRKK